METPISSQITFRQISAEDLEDVIAIENLGFTPEEAATPEAFQIRIENIPDSFILAQLDGRTIGFIDGPVVSKRYITDDLFETVKPNPTTGGHQSVLGLAVHPAMRKKGIGSLLIQELIRISTAARRETITLTCRDMNVEFYTRLGFVNEGESESTHGGYVWYNMIYQIAPLTTSEASE